MLRFNVSIMVEAQLQSYAALLMTSNAGLSLEIYTFNMMHKYNVTLQSILFKYLTP